MLQTSITVHGFEMTEAESRHVEQQLDMLARRLVHRPDPKAVLVLKSYGQRREIEADLRVQLGPLGAHLISRESAETPDRATHLAVKDVERQLERRLATQRGEPTFGVPSRRRTDDPKRSSVPSETSEESELDVL